MTILTGLILTIQFLTWINASHQTFLTGRTSLIFTDYSGRERKIHADIYYPSDTGGENSPVTSKAFKKFPVLCFSHGYLMGADSYSNISEALVPEGYIMIFPGTGRGLFPSHKAMSRDIGLVLGRIEELGKDTNSIFFERIDTNKCVMGHSMGGGASFLAAGMFPDIRCLVALAPYNTRPSAIEAAAIISIPALIITGSHDCITPAGKHQLPMYKSLASSSKTIIHIKGGTHCQMAINNSLCRFGESLKSCKAEITMEEQHRIMNRYIVPWLNFYLKGDRGAGELFEREIRSDTTIDFEKSGDICIYGPH